MPTGFELDSAYFLRQRATPSGHAFKAITVHRFYVQQEILFKSADQFNVHQGTQNAKHQPTAFKHNSFLVSA